MMGGGGGGDDEGGGERQLEESRGDGGERHLHLHLHLLHQKRGGRRETRRDHF